MFAYDPTDFAANELLLQQAVMNAFTLLLLLITVVIAAVSVLAALTAFGGMLWQTLAPAKTAAHRPTAQPSHATALAACLRAKSPTTRLMDRVAPLMAGKTSGD